MTIDADKAELGTFSQAKPLEWGILKQKAKDLGVSTQDLILKAAEMIKNQPIQHEQQTTINQPQNQENLKAEIKAIQQAILLLAKQQAQPADQFAGMKSMIETMKAMREYDNSVIQGFKQIQEQIRTESPEIEEIYDQPDDNPLSFIKELNSILGSFAPGAAAPGAQAPMHANTSPGIQGGEIKKNQESDPEMRANTKLIVAAIPAEIKEQIYEGKISEDQFMIKAREEANKRGLHIDDHTIKEVYQEIMRK
jgi:hypothetical protein